MKYRFSLLSLIIICLLTQLTNSLCLFCEEVKKQNAPKYNSFEFVQDIHNFLKFNQRQTYTGHNTGEFSEEVADTIQNETTAYYRELIDLKPEIEEPIVTTEGGLIGSEYQVTEEEPQEDLISYEIDTPKNQPPEETFADTIQNETTAYYRDLIDLKPEIEEPIVTLEDELIDSEYQVTEEEPQEDLISYEIDTPKNQPPEETFADTIQNETTAYYRDLFDQKPDEEVTEGTYLDDFYVYEIESPEAETPQNEQKKLRQNKKLVYKNDIFKIESERQKRKDPAAEEFVIFEYQRHLEPIKTDKKNNALSIAGVSANLGLELGINAYQVVLDPRHKTGLYAEVNFPVEKIWKKLGDRFEKDEILIQLEDSVPQSNYDKAVAQLDQAFAKFEAISQLYKDNLSSLFELKETETEIAKSKAELTLAERNLHSTQIVAPYSGIIDTIYIEEHELPSNGKELIKVIDDEVLIARLLVPSKLLPMIRVGLPFTIHISETDEKIKARISRIGGMIDPASSTMKIEAEIENHERKFKAGMSGIATFDTTEIYRNFN